MLRNDHQLNCSIRIISPLTGFYARDRNAENSTWSYMLRNNLLDLVWTKEKLGSGDDLIQGTDVIGITT